MGLFDSEVGDELPAGRRRLALSLRALCGLLGLPTQKEVADHLAAHGYKKDPSELSRYLSGKRVPPRNFVDLLYGLAFKACQHEETVWRALTEAIGEGAPDATDSAELLGEVHSHAEPRLCPTCPRLQREIRELHGGKAGLEKQLAATLQRHKAQLAAAQRQHETELAAAVNEAARLPVPPVEGDRQRRAHDVAAAQQITNRTVTLHRQGELEAALTVLREQAKRMTPLENAASVVLLREQQDQLADTLLQTYGRDQPAESVMRVAVELHEYGLSEDAGAILRAALG